MTRGALCCSCLRVGHETCDSCEGSTLLADADVEARIDDLAFRIVGLDSEEAHRAEDCLSRHALRAIRDGLAKDPRELASKMVALLSDSRRRWFA